jgi:predicted ATPase
MENKIITPNKIQKIILTGGPGSGKSSLILRLEQLGEYTIKESAEDIIKYNGALGNTQPWNDPNFQKWIYNLQKQREEQIPQGIQRIFIDRGIPDGLGYCKHFNQEPFKELVQESQRLDYHNQIFLIKNLGHCQKTNVRREDLSEALKLETALKESYQDLGYNIVKVPQLPLKERTEFILNKLTGGKQNG